MGRKLVLVVSLLFLSLINYAQDDSFFVKTSGDTIRCVITRLTSDYLFYSIDGVRSRIELDNVKSHSGLTKKESSETLQDSVLLMQEEPINSEPEEAIFDRLAGISNSQKIRIAVNLGAGYRVAQASPDVPKGYANQLRLGLHYHTKFQYFVRRDAGLGLEYHQFFNKSQYTFPQVGPVSDNIRISYLGISSIKRKQESDRGDRSYFEIGLGAIFYKDMAVANGQPLLIEGTTFGINVQYGYDLVISESMSIGVNVGFLLARLYSIDVNGIPVTTQNPDDGESLSRIDLGVGFRFSR